jgi:hypothetical protein
MMFVHGTKANVLGHHRNDAIASGIFWRAPQRLGSLGCLGREGRRNRRDCHPGSPHCMLRTTWPEEPLVAKQSGKQERI